MTVSVTSTVNSSVGNGVTTVFPYAFRILAAADLEVSVDGVVKTLGVDYSVSGVGSGSGGNVTFGAAPANGATVIRRRDMALVRTTDYQDNGDLLADVLNPDQDAAVMMLQQVQEQVDRAPKAPLGEGPIGALPSATARANKTLAFDDNGSPIAVATAVDAQAAVNLALGYRNEAQAFRDASEGFKNGAETAQGGANTARLAAEAARDSANAATRIFSSTADAGVTALSIGDYFYIPSTIATESLILYKKTGASAWTEIKRTPSAQAVNDLREAPRDPVALWPVEGYTAGSNPFIPNLANASPAASANLKRAPRRAFSSQFYFKSSVTVVDNSVDGLVAGTTDAAVMTGTGNWQLKMGISGTMPAGTYTAVITCKRNGGSDQPISFTKDAAATRITPQNATSVYQRLAFPFTLGVATSLVSLALCSSDGATGATINLESIEIFPGSADLGRTADDGNIYVGRCHDPAAPSYASGVLSDAAANASAALLTQKYAMAKWSVSYLVEVASRPSTTSPVISDLNHDPSTPFTSFQNWNAQVEGSPSSPANSPMQATGNAAMKNQIGASSGVFTLGGLFNFVGKNYHLFTRTYDGVAEELWVDDVRMFRYEHAITARNLRDFLLFVDSNGVGPGLNYSGLIGLWDRALSAAEIRQFFYYQRVRNPSRTIPGLRSLRVLAVEGDSNHGGQTNTCWPWLFGPNDSPENIASVWAVIGSTLVDLNARASQLDASIPPDQFERKFILTVADGTNDLGTYSSTAQFITDLRAYCVARVAAGWTLCLFTLPPLDGDATFNGRRATVNADIRTNWALYGLASAGRVIDIAADAIIGPDNSRTVNPTYWADTKHFSATGNAVVETYARAVINAI